MPVAAAVLAGGADTGVSAADTAAGVDGAVAVGVAVVGACVVPVSRSGRSTSTSTTSTSNAATIAAASIVVRPSRPTVSSLSARPRLYSTSVRSVVTSQGSVGTCSPKAPSQSASVASAAPSQRSGLFRAPPVARVTVQEAPRARPADPFHGVVAGVARCTQTQRGLVGEALAEGLQPLRFEQSAARRGAPATCAALHQAPAQPRRALQRVPRPEAVLAVPHPGVQQREPRQQARVVQVRRHRPRTRLARCAFACHPSRVRRVLRGLTRRRAAAGQPPARRQP